MFSLQRFLGEDDKFFDLLEASGEECLASAQALRRIVDAGATAPNLQEFSVSRRKDKQITTEINTLLCRVSVTALDPEDIEALSNALYKIPKTLEKFAERYIISASHVEMAGFHRQSILIEKAIGILLTMLRELKQHFHVEKLRSQNEGLQAVEGEADKLVLDLMKELYSGGYDTLKVMILKDLYELLEEVVDRCRDAGNVISQIALKNS